MTKRSSDASPDNPKTELRQLLRSLNIAPSPFPEGRYLMAEVVMIATSDNIYFQLLFFLRLPLHFRGLQGGLCDGYRGQQYDGGVQGGERKTT